MLKNLLKREPTHKLLKMSSRGIRVSQNYQLSEHAVAKDVLNMNDEERFESYSSGSRTPLNTGNAQLLGQGSLTFANEVLAA